MRNIENEKYNTDKIKYKEQHFAVYTKKGKNC